MCTAINETRGRHVFGRTLDLECSFGEEVVITPRNFPLRFLHSKTLNNHYAMIGTSHVEGGVPLYYDAANESGLCAAALNFKGLAKYASASSDVRSIASFELIPWVLATAKSVEQVRRLLSNAKITDDRFSYELPTTPLHWIFADKVSSVTVEQSENGLKIHDNPYGVLSNSPDFLSQIYNLEHYLHIIESDFYAPDLHSRGLSGFGIPGDYSSGSRFVRAVYTKSRTLPEREKHAAVSRHLHLLDTVSQPNGATSAEDGKAVRTVYASAIDTHSLEYCFTTYENRRIRCVKLDTPSVLGEDLIRFPMHSTEDVLYLN